MKPEEIDLSSIDKMFEYEKHARFIDNLNDYDETIGIQFHHTHPRTVLASIQLLGHQILQFSQAVPKGAVLFLVILQRFSQPNESNTTFMFYRVTHGSCRAKLHDSRR